MSPPWVCAVQRWRCGNGAMVEPLRHRQTKGAATDMFYLTPPRHISTLPKAPLGGSFSCSRFALMSRRFRSTAGLDIGAKQQTLACSKEALPFARLCVGFAATSDDGRLRW